MHTGRISIDPARVSARTTDILSSLVIDLDPIESDIEQVSVSRVQVELEQESHRHCNRFILLKELHLVGRGV